MTRNRLEYTLHDYVQLTLQDFLHELGDQAPVNLYNMVISQVETALLKTVMTYSKENQSKAAQFLGMNRGTLRKKLKEYHIETNDN